MVKMRLARFGSKRNPIYRIVVADAGSPRDGRAIESIGRYAPREEPSLIEIDADRARHWLSVGAQPSQPVKRLLQKKGIV
jgi:small subunit ribosomal protein S16